MKTIHRSEDDMDEKKCKHEYGSYKGTGQLWCCECGVELDVITRKPIAKDGAE